MGEGYLGGTQASHLGVGDLLLAPDRFVVLVTSFGRRQHAEQHPGGCCICLSSQYQKEKRQIVRTRRSRRFSCPQGLDLKTSGQMFITLPSCKLFCWGGQGAPGEEHDVPWDPDLILGLREGKNRLSPPKIYVKHRDNKALKLLQDYLRKTVIKRIFHSWWWGHYLLFIFISSSIFLSKSKAHKTLLIFTALALPFFFSFPP